MYVNQIDDLFDTIINNFYEYTEKTKLFDKISKDENFVKFRGNIVDFIKDFTTKTVDKKKIIDIVKKESYYEYIFDTIKRYCAYYVYLGLAYHYEGGRDLYITNIIETAQNQKESTFQIPNFYNVENNSKLINFFIDIKNILTVFQASKTMDKIKIVMMNNPLKFDSTISLFNELGEDYIIDNFLIKDNFHNIIKTLIFKQIYLKEEKDQIFSFLNQTEKEEGEYRYIEIIQSSEKKLIDFSLIQKFLNIQQLKAGLAEEFYNYLEEMRDKREIITREKNEFVNFLFSRGILVPITEEFLRYHDDNEKYDPESLVSENLKERDATKIKYIINKMNNVRNYYSPLLEKNPKLKLDTEKLFSRNQDPRKAVLYNENEEVKIVQKLETSENAGDADLLIDLENIRKYSYVNFKNESKDSIKLRTPKTIQAIRYINLLNKPKIPLELRIGHDNIDLVVVGIAWNPSQIPLECFTREDLIDVNKLVKSENGFTSFIKTMNKTFDKTNKKLYYWLFDAQKDIPKSKEYIDVNFDDPKKNIKTMISLIYDYYIDLVKDKYVKYIKTVDELTIWNMDNILRGYASHYFDFNLNPEIKNQLIEKSLKKGLKEVEIKEDDVDNMMPGKREKIIELPKVEIDKKEMNIVILNKPDEEDIILEKEKNVALCLHYIKWRNINRMSKSSSDEFSQAVVDFAKQYVKLNEKGDYICKSCNELLSIKKFIYEGTYVEELDTFMTTNIAVNQRLEEIPKYSKFMRTIRNLEKNIEKIAYSCDLNVYIGTSPTIRLKRKLIIKDVLDLILLHTEYLRKQPKTRMEEFNKKYNINKDLTNLFFFELKDEIFLTSSTDTDYYKLIKYNNVMAYLIFLIILDLNPGQLLGLKDDKRCNFFFFDKAGKPIFENLYLRRNQKDRISFSKMPLLSYAIFYFACVLTNSRIWLWNDNDEKDTKAKQIKSIAIQKSIIHTIVDLMNTLVEAHLDYQTNKSDKKETSYLYDFILTRFDQKIEYTFNDSELMKRIEEKSNKFIKFDDKTKQISFIAKKSFIVNPKELVLHNEPIKELCESSVVEMSHTEEHIANNNLDLLTNCPDGKFHKWKYEKNDMICENCNQSYNELLKLYKTTSEESVVDENKKYIEKLRLMNLEKLSKKYCITGETHELKDGVCSKCKKNINEIKLTTKELEQMNKNIEEKTYESNIEAFNLMKKHIDEKIKEEERVNKTVKKFKKRYEEYTNNKLAYYVIDFIEKLMKILGPKIKIGNTIIQLKDSVYIIDHDYLGNERKEPVSIPINDPKIEIYRQHPHYKRDIVYYKDRANNIYVYYDLITLQYLGYSENNREYKKTKANATLKLDYSIKDIIMLLGLENQYINLYHINSQYQKMSEDDIKKEYNTIMSSYFRNRINNLKQIISRCQSIVNNINNSGSISNMYNKEEKELVNEFVKKIKNINLRDEKGHNMVFKHWRLISNNLGLKKTPDNLNLNISKNYLDTYTFLNLNNTDAKLIFYLIFNLSKLLDFNTQVAIRTEIAYMIVKLIRFSFNIYYTPYTDSQIRKFDFVMINETPYIDENLKVVGFYQELLNNKEIDSRVDKEKDTNIDTKEAFESMDVDDYEVNDDIDESMEAYDGDMGLND
jgi:hypothetical protein